MEALSTAPPAEFPASCVADGFPRVVSRPARVWWRFLSASPTVRHWIATSPYQGENFVRLVLLMPFHIELTLNLDLEPGWVQACHKRLADDACGASHECPTRITENVFSTWVLEVLLQAALNCISPVYSSSFGRHGHTTAHLCRRNRRVNRIARSTLRVLSKSLAKIVVLQFRSIEICSRQG